MNKIINFEHYRWKKMLSSTQSTLCREEEILLKKLSKPPKCMHDPAHVIERENHWKCGECGLIERKTITGYL